MEPQRIPPERKFAAKSNPQRGEESLHLSTPNQREAYIPLPQLKPKEISKPRKGFMPLVASITLAILLGAGILCYHFDPAMFASHVQKSTDVSLTITSGDLDKEATIQAVTALKNGLNIPLVASLPDLYKTQILNGERLFYNIPLVSKQGDQLRQGDRIRVSFNGHFYGDYDLAQVPSTLTLPLKLGDTVTITCLSVSEGKQMLSFRMNTMLNPVVTDTLKPGDQEVWSVQRVSR
jgi:hypothetical protein